jgi:uncharacterized protein (TIGR04255 family)
MSDAGLKLKNPPIVEAVIDIDCDLPPGTELAALKEPARALFHDRYPNLRQHFIPEHRYEMHRAEPPKIEARAGLRALQFLAEDEKQLVQVRTTGFSFNRLSPYSSLDDYLPEIGRTWRLFVELAKPVQMRRVALRYINRILLPFAGGKVRLEQFLAVPPHLPDEVSLEFVGFFRQHTAIEKATGNEVTIMLTTQPAGSEHQPLIFDIAAAHALAVEPDNWELVVEQIASLRNLKNRVFKNTLTEECLNLFQQ